MSAAGEFVRRNAKAVVSGVGGILTVGTAFVALLQLVPDAAVPAGVVAAVLTVLEVLRTANVWLVRNGPALGDVVDRGAELVAEVQEVIAHGRHPAVARGDGP
ncbi:hypothetical protein ACIBCN_18905 [Nocardia sp. NPDC051052]|uniref:hypothetical protein n=1 Tax=Nocardia sp. NPDC051052 TaxID=3364322 RepID=UPI003790E9C7